MEKNGARANRDIQCDAISIDLSIIVGAYIPTQIKGLLRKGLA